MEEGKFIYRDSIITISYNFWHKRGSLSYIITNKSDKPLYIDWSHSNFIYKGYSIDYWKDEENVISNSLTSYYKNIALNTGISVIHKEKPQTQLPPFSSIAIQDKFLFEEPYFNDPSWNRKHPNIKDHNKSDSLTEYNTILFFRNYICLSRSPIYQNHFFIDNSFWVSKIQNKDDLSFNKKFQIANNIWTVANAYDSFKTILFIFPGIPLIAIGLLFLSYLLPVLAI